MRYFHCTHKQRHRFIGTWLAILIIAICQGALLHANPVGLVISEIMYNPRGEDADPQVGELEFIEIHNRGPVVFDLSGYRLTGGIEFVFPAGTLLAGHGYLAVAANETRLKELHPHANIIGDFTGRLENSGESVSLCLKNGGPICTVRYNDRNRWPSSADGTGHSLILSAPYSNPGQAASWQGSPQQGGSPGQPNFPEPQVVDHELIPQDDYWRYHKGTSAPSSPATAWRQIDFDDSGWILGQTGIGYGDNDDNTVLSDMQNNYPSFFARKTFLVSDPFALHEIYLKVIYDDGFVAYLNGTEVARNNVGDTGHDQTATGSHEAGGFEYFPVTNLLRQGTNVLACQVHNVSLTSSDCSFIPALINRETIIPEEINIPDLVLNEILATGDDASFIEIRNNGADTVNAGGFMLTMDLGDHVEEYELPANTMIPSEASLLIPGEDLPFTLETEELRLFLWNSTGQIVDARIFQPQTAFISHGRWPDGGPLWINCDTPTPGAPNLKPDTENIMINEIMYQPITRNPLDEYVELYNGEDHTVDLSGYAMTNGISYLFPDGISLGPGQYLVIAANKDHLTRKYGLNENEVLGDYTGLLDNNGEALRLVDAAGRLVDEVRYHDGGRWPVWANGLGSSLELTDPRQDNQWPGAWAASLDTDPASWQQVAYTGTCPRSPRESELHLLLLDDGECLIDNVVLKQGPAGANLIPNGDFESSNMSAWRGIGTHIFSGRTTQDSFSGNGCLHLIATGRGNNRANFVEVNTSTALQAGVTYTISFSVKWLRGNNMLHTRGFEFGLMNTTRILLPTRLGTPGRRNSTWQSNTGPLISQVAQTPAVPGTNQDVLVTARVSDSHPINSVQLHYTTQRPAGFNSMTMYDDGLHDDGKAGDGVWATAIPGHALRTKVLFYIEAADSLGARRTYPDDAPDRTCLYQVDSPVASNLYVYRLILDDDNTSEIQGRLLHSNHMLDGTFCFNDSEIYHNVGIRYRGSPWQRRGNPKMFRVAMNDDEPFHGMEKFNLSKYGNRQNERAAYYTVRENGGPSSFQFYVRLHYNGSHHMTSEHIQPVDKNWLELWYPDDSDGNLYKISARHKILDDGSTFVEHQFCQFSDYGDNPDAYRWNFLSRTNDLVDDHRDLMALCKLFDTGETSTATFDELVESRIDTDQWIRVHAMRVVNDDWDTIGVRNGQNAYIYYASHVGLWRLLPWDVDHTFSNVNASLLPTPDPGTNRLLSRPRYRRRYYRCLHEMINSFYTVDHMSGILDPTETVLSTESGGSASPDGITNFITQRTSQIRSFLPDTSGAMTITTNNGQPFETEETFTVLSGTAPINIATIIHQDKELDLSWSTTTRWIATVPLIPGTNTVQLWGYDGFGEYVSSALILVTCTTEWPAPEITGMTPSAGQVSGGNLVTIQGANFNETSQVLFDDIPAEITYQTETVLKAVSPPGEGAVTVTVLNGDDKSAEAPEQFHYVHPFLRGDANSDGRIDLADPVLILGYMFNNEQLMCRKAGDANDSGQIDLADAIFLLTYQFDEGDPPPAPGTCGLDPTQDGLSCDTFPGCQ